ncbi:diadenylate cyclase CdaA [Simkania negevensis]|uniref:Diadenylate cyclase n=1 Tax=Simkania negevensis TaxID=83561 RepID=A0ABS3ASE5_9BACT|nr:diadenylate cyclase CdaA [Simkania negevensis]
MFVPIIEILIIAIFLNYLLTIFWNTRAMDVAVGFIVFLIISATASWFHLPVLQKIMVNIVNVVVLAFFIIFQPELRLALSRISVKGKKYKRIVEFDLFLEQLAQTVYYMSERQTGAIILLENQDSLDAYATKGVAVSGEFSPELLESLFMISSPLHDGAVIIRGNSILAAAVILPLAEEDSQLARTMGTRHRAGLGISQVADCLVIVVSEETGKISIARDGIITRGVKKDRFKGIVRSIFSPPKLEGGFKFVEWLKR